MLELPAYHWPHLRNLAGPVGTREDLPHARRYHHPELMIMLWFLSTFPGAPDNATIRPSTTAWPASWAAAWK
jgi:ferrous iron transport protein B